MPETTFRLGVYLPAFVFPGEPPPRVGELQDFAREAEDLGFDSLWVIDHLFEAPPAYRVVFMEPVTTLAAVVGATRRVTLGTGILVLPLRDPVVTAKAFANLDAISGGRLVFGVGVGWDEREFLFTIPEVTLEPKPAQTPHPPFWFAGGVVPLGGSRHITTAPGYTPERSFQRVAEWGDGFVTAYRSAPGLDMSHLRASWAAVAERARAQGRDPSAIRFAHQDHLHIDRDPHPQRLEAVFRRFSHHRYDNTAPLYLMGHPDDLIPRIQGRLDAGVQEFMMNPMTRDPEQLRPFMRDIRPHLRPGRGA